MAQDEGVVGRLPLIGQGGAGVDELSAQDQQGVELELVFRAFFADRGLETAGIDRQEMSIDPIRLGQEALGLREAAHPAGLHAGDGQCRIEGGVEKKLLVTAGGFQDDQSRPQLPHVFDQLRDPGGIVGENDNPGLALDGQIELVFGDIN